MGAPARLSLYRLYLKSLDWLFPARCLACGRLGAVWCPDCRSKVKLARPPLCDCCGLPLTKGRLCRSCRAHPPHFDAARAWASYDAALRPAVVELKYRANQALAWLLAEELAGRLDRLGWRVDGVIPVPLAAARLRQRGHNQAALLARPLALQSGLDYRPRALRRPVETPKQVGLSPPERRRNMQGAFQAEDAVVRGGSWLLVDDVMTTGATMDAAAAALKAGGALRVHALALGRATLASQV